jgi:hypothetical protein
LSSSSFDTTLWAKLGATRRIKLAGIAAIKINAITRISALIY